VALSTLLCKWVLGKLTLGVTLPYTSIPSRGSSPYHFMPLKMEISTSLMDYLALIQTFFVRQKINGDLEGGRGDPGCSRYHPSPLLL